MISKPLLFLATVGCFVSLIYNAVAVTQNIDVKVIHGVPITSCSNFQSNTQYILTVDINTNCYFPTDGTNILLDCNRHSINTSTDPYSTTITLQGSNSTIANCVITSGSGNAAGGVAILGTGNTLNNSTVSGNSRTNVGINGSNHRITNNNIAGGSQTDDNILTTGVDNLLIDGNTIEGNYDLAIESFISITNSKISNNKLYVSGSGYGAIGGYYTNGVVCCLLMSGTTIVNNSINGTPWFFFQTTKGNYKNSVDADAQTALDNGNTFSGNTAF